ncbi:MAG: hypothetical protein O3B31_12570 [Chloroflexi bacterium]|nr:hypothetical protein [Chloroflexota bacterium]
MANQRLTLSRDPDRDVHRSTCERCHRTAIWENARVVFPSEDARQLERELAGAAVTEIDDGGTSTRALLRRIGACARCLG